MPIAKSIREIHDRKFTMDGSGVTFKTQRKIRKHHVSCGKMQHDVPGKKKMPKQVSRYKRDTCGGNTLKSRK